MNPLRPKTLLLAALLLGSAQVHAQLFDFGPKLGVNRDDLMTPYRNEPLIGGHVGLFARVKPPIFPGAQGELLLTSIGSQVTVEGYTAELRGLALQAPLFAVVAFGPFELHGGIYYQRQLSKSLARNFSVEIEGVEINGEDIELDDLADNGFGLLMGAGVRFGHFYAGARYNMDMQPLGSEPFLHDVYGRQLQAYVGFGLLKPPKR